jgi:hypothetical protein
MFDESAESAQGKEIEMMWQATGPVDLAADAAMIKRACARRATKWCSPGVSWRNG